MKNLATLSLILPLLALSSCIESDSAYTLNPDRSGKVMHQVKFKKTAGNWTDEDPARTFALGFIRGTRGVEAWDDVHYRMTDSGKAVEFRGTAYFRDINQVELGSFLKDGDIQQLPIPMMEMTEKEGKQVIALKDPPVWKMKTGMEITVNGVPVPDDDRGEGEDGKEDPLSGISSIMAASFALTGDIKTTVQVNGKITGKNGFTVDESGRSATLRYQPDFEGKSGKEEFAKRFEEAFGAKPDEAAFDELFAGGIFENEKLQKAVTGETPPFTATLEFEKDAFDFDTEVAKADFTLTEKEAAGWKKLESLDP